ncbi:hypothetical protein SAMN04488564_113234 [Lentzea waywayandensis]|uniref:Lipoprotein n=1 Tax=Lentzea waywayandensis TaxID=84724 RepID=A0A1I6FEI4_9PSEU|nr:hypothetical protein [Lentzea waywayandensis]SFR28386.1 hypothetical protein SAMN04488564_113234 [Lentzea waywayandensis]
MYRIAAGILATTLLTACGSPSTSSPTGSTNTPVIQAENKPATPKTAEEVTNALAQKIPSLKLTKVFTAEDDPNKQLGRPNGYTSKTAFTDTRVAVEGLVAITKENDTLRGGGVEVFADEAAAKARMDYIQSIGKQTPLLVEYDYVTGGVLVRVSKQLTPTQAKEYETALAGIIG